MGRSALATIRVSGENAVDAVSQLFSRSDTLLGSPGGRVYYGRLEHEGSLLDEVMLAVFRAPRSYTGEDVVEISCHGSPPGIARILTALRAVGCRDAQAGEFTYRAFLNGKLDLTRAEAIQEIVEAQTEKAHELALERLSGSIERRINAEKERLTRVLAAISIQLDYPEEDTGEIPIPREQIVSVREACMSLAAGLSRGRLYQEGVPVVLAGKTNAGKSSLFNALLGRDRAIVSQTPGTTRDYLEASIDLFGIPVRLYDTAGLRATSEAIESEGIRRGGEVAEHSAAIILVRDASEERNPSSESNDNFARPQGDIPILVALNKWDLVGDSSTEPLGENEIRISARTGYGMDELRERLRSVLGADDRSRSSEPLIDNKRQHDLLIRCAQALEHTLEGIDSEMPLDAIAVDVQDALAALGEITGEVSTDDVLSAMFSGFCVGK
jgi:tRNA modification GTPase